MAMGPLLADKERYIGRLLTGYCQVQEGSRESLKIVGEKEVDYFVRNKLRPWLPVRRGDRHLHWIVIGRCLGVRATES